MTCDSNRPTCCSPMSVYLDHNASSTKHANSAGIAGLGKAAELARLEIELRRHHLQQLRDLFENRLQNIDRLASRIQQLVDSLSAVVRRAAA